VVQVVLNVLERDNRYMVAIPPYSNTNQGNAREALVFDITPKVQGDTFVVNPKEVE
jgi:hypothetical protein